MRRSTLSLLLWMLPGIASAQARPAPPSSPVMDMLETAKNALNNLQYTQARSAAREVLGLSRLKRSQEIAALQVASAAYFPDEADARMPDSATVFLRRLARLMPTGPFPADLVSAALDSQMVVARLSTFGATARAPLEVTLKGTESRTVIEVVSTRLARWQLYMSSADGGPPILLDTLGSANSGRLSLRAHNGASAVISPGNYQFKVLSISSTEADTITLRFEGVATGSVPTLVEMPRGFDSSKLLPERSKKAVGVAIAGAVVAAGGTWALGNSLKPPKALGNEVEDGRAAAIGLSIGLGALAGGFLDKGRTLPANIKANAQLRSGYLKEVGDATETNRKRVNEYALALTIDPEIK